MLNIAARNSENMRDLFFRNRMRWIQSQGNFLLIFLHNIFEQSFVVCSIFILLPRDSDGDDFLPLNLLLVRSHQAEIIIVKHLIQGRNNVSDKGDWECNLDQAIMITRSP